MPAFESPLFTSSNNRPTQPLLDLLKLWDLAHDGSLSGIVAATQARWFRPDPAYIANLDQSQGKTKEDALGLLKQLNQIEEAPIPPGEYDWMLVAGATLPAVRGRIAYATKFASTFSFRHVALLGNERPLDPVNARETLEALNDRNNKSLPIRDEWQQLTELPPDEARMIPVLWNQAALPESWRKHVPLEVKATGRGGTRQTVAELVRLAPTIKGKVLLLSQQPFVWYQTLCAKNEFRKQGCEVEVVGAGFALTIQTSVAAVMSHFARVIFEEKEARSEG